MDGRGRGRIDGWAREGGGQMALCSGRKGGRKGWSEWQMTRREGKRDGEKAGTEGR